MTVELGCFWSSTWGYAEPGDPQPFEGPFLEGVRTLAPFSARLAGEPVDLWIGGGKKPHWDSTAGSSTLFVIHRHSAASYVAGPATGTTELVEAHETELRWTLRFTDIAPDPATASALVDSPADWVRPLGEDPSMARLSGTLDWRCEEAPATLATAPDDERWARAWPFALGCDPHPLVLASGDRRQEGERACTSCDNCGPTTYSMAPDSIVRVPTGATLRFELGDPEAHFIAWSVGRMASSDAARLDRLQADEQAGRVSGSAPLDPADFITVVDTGRISEGPVLEVPAPPRGDWVIGVGWSEQGKSGVGMITDSEESYLVPGGASFRVVVGD